MLVGARLLAAAVVPGVAEVGELEAALLVALALGSPEVVRGRRRRGGRVARLVLDLPGADTA
eukprot:1433424-Alexandrium_andersonii.AAC.1